MRVSDHIKVSRRHRILIVDDEPFATRALGKLLTKLGYHVAAENDSNKAHKLALRFQPDLIILDVCMPWKTGEDLSALFIQDEQLCSVPIVFMTAYISFTPPESPRSFPVLIKPFSIEDLLAHITQGLAQQSDPMRLSA